MMVFIRARRFVSVCAPTAAVMAALVAPGAASAGTVGEQCSGSDILGQGASAQKIAQQNVWDPDFNTSANARACNGTQGSKGIPTVTYTSTSSGAGMEAWGVNGHAFEGSNGFVGTDEPPNETQKAEIEAHKIKPRSESSLETIPVLEGAVTIVVDLPAGCTATSTPYNGRLVLDNVTLEEIWAGEITKWNQITESGDKLKGSTCTAAQKESTITRIVRPDQAGLTSELKKYLALINEAPVIGELGWREISEGAENTTWPGTVTRPSEKGDSALIKLVASTPGSIGYATLADARANSSFIPPTGGNNKGTFWAPIQNNGLEQEEATYADPSSDLDKAELGNANCENTEYTNGMTPFPPASTLDAWNEVTTSTTEINYPLCGLTYDLTFHEYSKYPGTSLAEATTVNNFLRFELAPSGGQVLIKKHDYLALPSALGMEAREGAEKTKF